MKYALIGQHLGHSYSQRHFQALFARPGLRAHTYTLCEMPSLDGLRRWVAEEGIDGFNITVPYKQEAIPLLDELDAEARAIGAVNCVSVEHGRLVGHNTDAPAFLASLTPLLTPAQRQAEALVMGTGGAARAVSYALTRAGIRHRMVSRTPSEGQLTYAEARQVVTARTGALLMINATPVGMTPEPDRCPWPWNEYPGAGCLAYDLVYNPSPTLFLSRAAAAGMATKDGLEMLRRQADLSWQLWQKTAAANL